MVDPPTTRSSLIVGLKADRSEAWERLYRNYWRVVYAFAYRATASHTDAEDLTQDTFAVVCAKIGRFDTRSGKGGFRAWLRAICTNNLRSLRRYKRRHPPPLPLDEAAAAPGPTPADMWDRYWYWNLYQLALRRLVRELRTLEHGVVQYAVFCLRCKDGLGYDKIIESINRDRPPDWPEINEHTVRNYVYRTKRLLRNYVEEAIRSYCETEEEFQEELAAARSFFMRQEPMG